MYLSLLFKTPFAILVAEAPHDSGNDFITALVVAIIAKDNLFLHYFLQHNRNCYYVGNVQIV